MRLLSTIYIALGLPTTLLASEIPSLLLSQSTATTTSSNQISQSTAASSEPSSTLLQPSSSSSPSSSPTQKHPTPTLGSLEHELLIRQAAGQVDGQNAVVSVPTQMSPVFTEMVYANGQMIPLLFTQTFAGVPEQWPQPSSGAIGLGTIQGQVGVTKTKRAVETLGVVKRGVDDVKEVIAGLAGKIGVVRDRRAYVH